MFILKIFTKIIALPMILVMTILFYVVSIFSKIYSLAATVFNQVFLLCAIICLALQQWHNLAIVVSILVVSYLILDMWDLIAGFFAVAKAFFTEVLVA